MKRFISVPLACAMAVLLTCACGCAGSATVSSASVATTPVAQEAQTIQDAASQAYEERLKSCKEQIEAICDFKPEVVIVLGTGMGDYADSHDIKQVIPYKDIVGWPVSTAPDHKGNLVFTEHNGIKLAIMQGRVHYYEGYSMPEVVLPLRVLHMLGAKTVILTNAVGSLNPEFKVGDFVCATDQISSFVPSPLIGPNDEGLGSRFVGMTDAFDEDMRNTVHAIGEQNGIAVHDGVYLQVTGPQYETPAEIKMYRSLGADTIGMSTAVEVIAARHMDMKVCVISCVSNMAAGMEEEGFSADTIHNTMDDSSQNLKTLIGGLLDSLST